jgi:hypothetical protein
VKKKTKKLESVEVPPSFAPVLAAFSKDRRVRCEKGWGAGNIVLKVKGKIFAMLVKGKLVAKLPKAKVDELVSQRVGQRFDPRGDGRVMKEWVVVGGAKEDWVALASEARDFVRSDG